MSALNSGKSLRQNTLGFRVERAASTIPATATQSIFTISGGRILVTGLLGEVTTVIGGVATTLSMVSTPTVGSATTLTSATAITSREVGALASLPVAGAGGALTVSNAGSLAQFPSAPWVVPAGTIGITTSATTTGAMKWSLTYIPLDDGASVTAAA